MIAPFQDFYRLQKYTIPRIFASVFRTIPRIFANIFRIIPIFFFLCVKKVCFLPNQSK